MIVDKHAFTRLLGTRVSLIRPGFGSFIDIFSQADGGDAYQLWIYLTNWAITEKGREVVSSDSDIKEFDFRALVGVDMKYLEITYLDEEEFHITFNNEIELEVWGNAAAYGNSSEMAYLYCNKKFVAEIKLGP